MTRYFYREPLDAAIMAARYGMRFDAESAAGTIGGTDPIDAQVLTDTAPSTWRGTRFIVRPESLPLLQPQLGDLIERADCFHFVVTAEEHKSTEAVPSFRNQTASINVVKAWPDPQETFIRMRGGQPFIHPERELA